MQETNASPRTCRPCGELKPIEDFDRRADSGGHHSLCKSCRRDYQRERWRQAHPPKPAIPRVIGSAEEFTCTRCGGIKPAAAFARRRRGDDELQTWCRACYRVIHAARYAANPEHEKRRVAAGKARRKEQNLRLLAEHIATQGCFACGETDINLLRLVDPRGRIRTISAVAGSARAWARIKTELSSYEVKCLSCVYAARLVAQPPKTRRRTTPFPPLDASLAALRQCTRCGELKPIEAFPPKYRDVPLPTSWCRQCRAAYHRDWYQRNRQAVIERIRANRTRAPRTAPRTIAYVQVRQFRWKYLADHPCIDCGEGDPLVLEFDHRAEKRAGINELIHKGATWAEILAEIERCDVRCANCHRRKTARTRGYYRDLLGPATATARLDARRRRWEYLLGHPCVDCGESDPVVLEFDHRTEKRAQIGDLVGDHARWTNVLVEIEKCDVRCANCHRRRTARTRGHYRELERFEAKGTSLREAGAA